MLCLSTHELEQFHPTMLVGFKVLNRGPVVCVTNYFYVDDDDDDDISLLRINK